MIYFIILLTICSFLLALSKIYLNSNYHRNLIVNIEKFMNGVPENLEIVNLGTSYSMYGYDYEDTELNGFNMALQPQSFINDFNILKQYKNNMKKGCIVLINVSVLSFGNNAEVHSNKRLNDKYYFFLNKEYIHEYSKLNEIITTRFPFIRNPRLLLQIIRKVPLRNELILKTNQFSYEEAEAVANQRVNGWCKNFNLNNMKDSTQAINHFKTFGEKQNLIIEMIEYCTTNELKPVFVIPPVSIVLRDKISSEFVQAFLKDNVEESNVMNIPVLDYWDDEEFKDKDLYIHCDFMNMTGRKKFTRRVINDLKRLNMC